MGSTRWSGSGRERSRNESGVPGSVARRALARRGEEMRSAVETQGAPKAIGPYSQAIRVSAGEMVFCSGQIGLDPSTQTLVTGGVEPETRRALENLQAVLAAAGLSTREVVRTTIYLTDLGDF